MLAVKLALLDPVGITTVGGTATSELLLTNATVRPGAGAAAVSDTLQLTLEPPAIDPGLQVRLPRLSAPVCSVRVTDAVTPEEDAHNTGF